MECRLLRAVTGEETATPTVQYLQLAVCAGIFVTIYVSSAAEVRGVGHG